MASSTATKRVALAALLLLAGKYRLLGSIQAYWNGRGTAKKAKSPAGKPSTLVLAAGGCESRLAARSKFPLPLSPNSPLTTPFPI